MRNEEKIKTVLEKVRNRKLSIEKAAALMKGLPSMSLGFADIDYGRYARCGFPEVVYCEGKTIQQIKLIAKEMFSREGFLLLTRLPEKEYKQLKKTLPFLKYNKMGRVAYCSKEKIEPKKRKVILIITGGTSDIPVAEEARATLEAMGNRIKLLYDVGVAGIHRLFKMMEQLDDVSVIIVIAGMEGALAGVVGGLVSKPVIAVPTSCGYGANFKGVAPLLTMLNSCAPGVAVVNIDNGFGAAYLANLINSNLG